MNNNLFKSSIFILFTSLFCISCVEEFWPDLDNNNESFLVVNGKITNKPGPYIVTIGKTCSLDSVPYAIDADFDFKGLSGANVIIMDDQGYTETLTELEAGVYTTAAEGIQGIIGNSYKLTISTPNGKHYESNFQKILPPLDIDTITSVEEQRTRYINNENITDVGLQFYISSNIADNENQYIYWELEDTYEYHSQYFIEHIFEGEFAGGQSHPHPPFNIPKLDNPDTLFYCYKTTPVNELYTYNLNKLATPKVINHPISFISYDNEKMEFKYSLNVKQLTVNKDAQEYLQKLSDQNAGQSGLYSVLPFQIRGNISNIENEEEAILGFFLAASYSNMKHAYYKAPDKPLLPDTFQICDIVVWDELPPYKEGVETRVLEYLKYYINPNYYPVYLTTAWACINCIPPPPPPPWKRIYAPRFSVVDAACVDCRLRKHNGTIKKPDYWIWDK